MRSSTSVSHTPIYPVILTGALGVCFAELDLLGELGGVSLVLLFAQRRLTAEQVDLRSCAPDTASIAVPTD